MLAARWSSPQSTIMRIVGPLTATVLAGAAARNGGIASGVHNAIVRGAGLMAMLD